MRYLKKHLILSVLVFFCAAACVFSQPDFVREILSCKSCLLTNAKNFRKKPSRTAFQTGGGYLPWTDIKTDIVILNTNDAAAIQSWKEKGYKIFVMGGFRENDKYIKGKADGKKHSDEIQVHKSGFPFTIGSGKGMGYYMSPTKERIPKYVEYYEKAVEAGAEAVCPEEPEYFTDAGYEKSFQKEWQEFYNEPYEMPHTSVDARVKADGLKAEMFLRMLRAIYDGAKKKNPLAKNFLLIHSPLNYTAWKTPFLYAKAVNTLNLDGIVGQVWTGTARTPVKYRGETKERVFENAFCEYSSLWNLVRGTKLQSNLWFLHDPVEDTPGLPEEDYHKNYENTVIASLMFPEVSHYEVMPWPTRIFAGEGYKISENYAVEMLTVINALQEIGGEKKWTMETGTEGIATFLGDSATLMRGEPFMTNMDSYYGLALPLLMKGIPVQTLYAERAHEKDYLKNVKVILLSYDLFKPPDAKFHEALLSWIKKGGVLLFFGKGNPYDDVKNSWWKKEGFSSPLDHLRKSGTGFYFFGTPPAQFAESEEGANELVEIVRDAVEKKLHKKFDERGYFVMRKGEYIAARTLSKPLTLKGKFVDLFDYHLPVIAEKNLKEDENAFLLDLSKMKLNMPRLLVSSGRVDCLNETKTATQFVVYAPDNTKNHTRIFTGGRKIKEVSAETLDGEPVSVETTPDSVTNTVLLSYPNHASGAAIKVLWN